jgi:hypothetical protein
MCEFSPSEIRIIKKLICKYSSTSIISVVDIDGDYTVLTTDDYIRVTNIGSVITLFDAVGNEGLKIMIKNVSGGNITIDTTSSQTIDGDLTIILSNLEVLEVISNGVNWDII